MARNLAARGALVGLPFLIFPFLAFGQARLGIYTGGSFPASALHSWGFHDFWASRWYPGINFGVSVAFPGSDWLEVGPGFEYSRMDTGVPPWEGTGEAAHVSRLILEAHLLREGINHCPGRP